jgi:hypothetical protein
MRGFSKSIVIAQTNQVTGEVASQVVVDEEGTFDFDDNAAKYLADCEGRNHQFRVSALLRS